MKKITALVIFLVGLGLQAQVLMIDRTEAVPGEAVIAMVYPRPSRQQAFLLTLPGGAEKECPGLYYPVEGYGVGWMTFIPVPPDSSAGEATLSWGDQEVSFQVNQRDFPHRRIPLSEDPQPEGAGDQRLYRQLGRFNSDQIYWDGSTFPTPVSSWKLISSTYGERRTFTRSGRSWNEIHQGTDYAQDRGYPVYSPLPGRVVISEYLDSPGNLVVVEIFPGIYQMYYHLDSRSVERGQIIEAGTLLGRVGSTGKSTGPHLHFEIRVHNVYLDPQIFLEEGYDLSEILPRMVSYHIQ